MFLNSYIIKQKICKIDTYVRKLQTMSYTRFGCWNVALRVSIDNYVLQTCLSLVEEKTGLYITDCLYIYIYIYTRLTLTDYTASVQTHISLTLCARIINTTLQIINFLSELISSQKLVYSTV
jgi:hypothetical protein